MLPYKCETCNQRFSVKWRLVHHQKTHEPEQEPKSDESDSSFQLSPKKVILKNTEVLQDFNTHECPVCHINFVGKKQLERHERVHGNKKYYQCDRCYLAFFWKSNFNRHRKQFCTRRVFQCETCHLTFNKKVQFLRHKKCHDTDQNQSEDPTDDSFDVQNAIPSTSTQMGQISEGPSTSKEPETDIEEVLLISPIKGKLRASKPTLNLNSSDKDGTDSKSEEKSEEELAADPNFDPKKRNPRPKYERKRKPMSQYEKKKKPRTNYERKHKCDLCHLGFRFKCDLGRHRRTHDTVKPFPCDQCDLGFNWKSNLVRHQKRMHLAEKTFSCDSCGEGFPKRFHLARHRSNSHDNDRKSSLRSKRRSSSYDCNCDCSNDSNPVVIQLHPSKNEDSETLENEPASTSKDDESGKRNHTSKSQEVNIVYLHACYDEIKPDSKEECNPERPIQETETVRIQEVYDCNVYDGSQRRKMDNEDSNQEAAVKKRLKKDAKEFVCSVCSRVFTRKSCHLQHERSHYKQQLKCEWCNRSFIRKSVFERHLRIHTGEKPFQCEVCRCFFRQKSQLAQHKKIHSGSKPHECDVCKRRFNRKSVLVRHKMIHTGEKPFECEVCHLCFNQKSILVQHLKIHTGLKPYKCKKCNYSFTQKWNYRRHKQRVHISGRTLSTKCNTCDSNFPRKRILIQREKGHPKKKFVFHIYNTRIAKKRCTRKDKSKEACKELDQTEEIYPHRSGMNDGSRNRNAIENEKTLLTKWGEIESQDIADFPDHCIPVNIYIRKDLRIRKSSNRDRNPVKTQNAKSFSEKENQDQDSKKNLDGISLEKKDFYVQGSNVAAQIESTIKTEDESNFEDCKKNQRENGVGNQQKKDDVNATNMDEISPVTECRDEIAGIKMNLSSQESQEDQNDVKESDTKPETLNSRKREGVGSGDKPSRNNGVEDNNISEITNILGNGCNENKNANFNEHCKDSSLAVEPEIAMKALVTNPPEEKQSQNALTNDCKEEINKVSKNSDINSNSSDLHIGNKNCVEKVLVNKNVDQQSGINHEDRKHSEIDVKTNGVPEISSNQKDQQPLTFVPKQDTSERNFLRNKSINGMSEELKEGETKIQTESRKWFSDVDFKSFQCFQENNTKVSSLEIFNVANDFIKPDLHEISTDSNSSMQVEGISANSRLQSDISARTFDQRFTNAAKKEITSSIELPSTAEIERLLKRKRGVVENSKHDSDIMWISKTEQKAFPNRDNLCSIDSGENSSHAQLEDEIQCVSRTKRINENTEETVAQQCNKLYRKGNRSKRRLKYRSMFGRKLINGPQDSIHSEEENIREAFSFLKINDEPTASEKVSNDTKEEQISITRQIVICQTKVIESIVKIAKKEDNIPHSTVNFVKVSPIVCPVKSPTSKLEQASDWMLKKTDFDDGNTGSKLVDEDRKNLESKMTYSEEMLSPSTKKCEDNNSDKNFIQRHDEDPPKKVLCDQKPGHKRNLDENLDKKHEFHSNVENKQMHYYESLQSGEVDDQNIEEKTEDKKQICKEDELRNKIETSLEKSCETLKNNALNFSENKESISLNYGKVDEQSDNTLKEIATLQKRIDTSNETNCEFSEKTVNLSVISPSKRQTGINDLLGEIDINEKPIQCGEINYTQNSCEEINSNENFVKYRDVSNVIDDTSLDDSKLNTIDHNNSQENRNGENSMVENADDQVSSSGIDHDCEFPQEGQTIQSSSERTEISTETQEGSERRLSPQNMHLCDKNSSDAFGFIDFSTLSSPERCSDFHTKSEISLFNNNKSTTQAQERDKAQSYPFHDKNYRNNSLDLMNDSGTDLELTPLQNMRPDSCFTENGEGYLSYQDMSENFSTPNRNHNHQRTEAFEPEKNNSGFVFLNSVQESLRPQVYHQYIIPFENIYQPSTIPVSATAQSIPSYAEAFSRPGLNDNNSVYSALYPESVGNSHSSVSRKDVGFTAKPSVSNHSSYGHQQYEDYMQNIYRDGNISTPQDAQNQSYSDIYRVQQMDSVDYVPKHTENSRNYPNTSYKYQFYTPKANEEPVSGHYETTYTFPTHSEESYNYSVRQEEVRTYAVHQEEVHTIEDLVQFEKTSTYPASPTGTPSMEVSSHYRESNTYQSAFSSNAALSSNYFRMNVPVNEDQTSVNTMPSENDLVLSLQLSPEQTHKNSREQQKKILKAPEELPRIRTPSFSMANIQISQNLPTVNVQNSPASSKPSKQTPKTPSRFNTQTPQGLFRVNVATPQNYSWTNLETSQKTQTLDMQHSPALPNPNKQTPKTPSRLNTQTPQGLFRTNVATPQNSSWTNLLIPQGTSRLAKQTPHTPIQLVKPSPHYPTNRPPGFVPSKGLKLLTITPGSSVQNQDGIFQDQDWRRRMDLDFERNRRIQFESPRVSASDNGQPKGIFIERHFRCDRCEHSYARKEDLIRHRFTAHEKFRVVKPASYMFIQ